MKTFANIRELTGRKPSGKLEVNKKIGKIQIQVYKEPRSRQLRSSRLRAILAVKKG